MKLKVIALILALLPVAAAFGKGKESPDTITARRAFLEMPSGKLDLLSADDRLDMLIYYDNDSIVPMTNNQKGISRLKEVTPDFLEVQLTGVSTLQLKVLKLKNGKEILMAIYTTGAEGETRDSDISFYDASLQPLPVEKYFPIPSLSDFFDTKGYKTSMKEIKEMIPFSTIVYQASAGNDNVTARLAPGDIISVEDMKLIEMFLKPGVTFYWNGKNFTQKK